tara:strand:+ start:5142 stop:5342 length:201 start_codon:yes stop_codon:yes gene_type:complete
MVEMTTEVIMYLILPVGILIALIPMWFIHIQGRKITRWSEKISYYICIIGACVFVVMLIFLYMNIP